MAERLIYYFVKYIGYSVFKVVSFLILLIKGKMARDGYTKKVNYSLGLLTAKIFCRDNANSFEIGFFLVKNPLSAELLDAKPVKAIYKAIKDEKKYSRIFSIQLNKYITLFEENPFHEFITEIYLKEQEGNFPLILNFSKPCYKGMEVTFTTEMQKNYDRVTLLFKNEYNLLIEKKLNLEHYLFRQVLINQLLTHHLTDSDLKLLKLLFFSNKIVRISKEKEGFNPEKSPVFITNEKTPFCFFGTANNLVIETYPNFYRVNIQHTGHGVNAGPNYKILHRFLFYVNSDLSVEETREDMVGAIDKCSEKISLKIQPTGSVKKRAFQPDELTLFHFMENKPDKQYQEVRERMRSEHLEINYTAFDFSSDMKFFKCKNVAIPFILKDEQLTYLESSDNTGLYVNSSRLENDNLSSSQYEVIDRLSREVNGLKEGRNPSRLPQFSTYYFPPEFLNLLYLTFGRLYKKTRELILCDFLYSNLASLKGEEKFRLTQQELGHGIKFWLYFKGSSINVNQLKTTTLSKAIAPTEYANYAISYKIDAEKLMELIPLYPEVAEKNDSSVDLTAGDPSAMDRNKKLFYSLYSVYLKSRKIPF